MQSTDSSYSVPPFPAFPSTGRYIPLGSVQEALGRVCRSVDAREAVSLVIGPPGTGKSLICGLLVEHYRDSRKVVVLGETPIADQAAFLRHLLHHLGANFNAIPDGDLQLALIDQVCGKEAPEGGLLIIVDEAQSLSSEVIESIRMVTNIMKEGEPRVVAVLCGGMKLDEILVEPCMEAFTQRVATRCYLHPMNGEETRRYVTETIRNCGADPDETITTEAIAAVHHACAGVPRLVNQMLTQAIDCAEDAERVQISAQIVDLAWAHLQQLPSPMVEEPKITRDAAPIEFGELDDSINFAEWSPSESTGSTDALSTDVPEQPAAVAQRSDEHRCETGECQPGECTTGNCQSAVSNSDSSVENDVEFKESTAQWVQEPGVQEPGVQEPGVQEPGVQGQWGLEQWGQGQWGQGPGVRGPAEHSSDPRVESAAASNAPTTSPSALFGHFEEEEEVKVGSGFAPSAPSPPATPPVNLEAMLRQELVGINAVACEDPAAPVICDDNNAHDFDDEPEEHVEDFIIEADDESEHAPVEDENPVLWVGETSLGQDCVDLQIRDDSDILVIEDEVELRRFDTAARVDSRDQTISVDFQAMLNRMRSGN